jgi:hypothetical protein
MINHVYNSTPFDPTLIRRITAAYGDMIRNKVGAGMGRVSSLDHVQGIRGPRNGVISRMLQNTASAYDRSLTRIVRNPLSPSQAGKLPIWSVCPDFPVPKKAKTQLRDVALDDGLHVGAIALLPPVNRLNRRRFA